MRYIDIGNSFIKIAEHNGNDWVVLIRAPHSQLSAVLELAKIQVDGGMDFFGCSVVSSLTQAFKKEFGNRIRFIEKSDVPSSQLNYGTPETLGMDRFVASYGAYKLGGSSVVVVDAGTATTIDLMDDHGIFHGGVIAPGIALLEKAIGDYAPSLPKVERSLPAEFPPKSTKDALKWGITGSYLTYINAHVKKLKAINKDAHVWVTGGDAEIIMQLKDFKFSYHPNLVFEGLRQMMLNNFLKEF
jgi:type III pantothenate kinase